MQNIVILAGWNWLNARTARQRRPKSRSSNLATRDALSGSCDALLRGPSIPGNSSHRASQGGRRSRDAVAHRVEQNAKYDAKTWPYDQYRAHLNDWQAKVIARMFPEGWPTRDGPARPPYGTWQPSSDMVR